MQDDKILAELIDAAKQVCQHAYTPYSGFPVGAALLSSSGEIFTGCNVENASFGLTVCAERNAIFSMVAQGLKTFTTLSIYTPTSDPTTPCGACRQVINQFNPEARVVSVCDGAGRIDTTCAKLLPHAFGPGNLTP